MWSSLLPAVVPTLAQVIENNAAARPSEIGKIDKALRLAGIDQRGTVALALPAGAAFALLAQCGAIWVTHVH
jgi:hypothetical protein